MTAPVRALLTDGRVVELRELGVDDLAQVRELHESLPEQDRYLRFFSLSRRNVSLFLDTLSEVDTRRGGLGAFLGERLIGVATYYVLADPTEAEIALVVAHPDQTHGVGTLLLEHLGALARRRGVLCFVAELLGENSRMKKVFDGCGLPSRTRWDGANLHVRLELTQDEHYLDAVQSREQVAGTASLRAVLEPTSVAVVGAGRGPDSVGNAVLRNLVEGGFTGSVWPVNPRADQVNGLRCFPSVADLPVPVDLAVLCVPAEAIPRVARECGERGVRALVVVTAGLTETPDLATALREIVGRYGMRMVGPNCLGVINTEPRVRLQATFGQRADLAGEVGVVTQSGGVGIALLERLGALGLGVSTVVSTGDKYDVSGNDLLLRWERDERTRIAVLYLESFGNPRKFSRIVRHLAADKPVLAVRTGTSEVARHAAASHTAAAVTSTVIRDALYHQAGVIAVDDLTELVDAVAVLRWQPLPAGAAVAIVGNAGGIGVLTADACAHAGLAVPRLSAQTTAGLAGRLPVTAALANPVDTTAVVSPETFTACLRTVLEDDAVHAVIATCVPTALGDVFAGVGGAAGLARRSGKPLIVVRPGQSAQVEPLATEDGGTVPSFAEPAGAARALAHAARYRGWLKRDPGRVPDLPGIDLGAARAAVADHLSARPGGGWLEPEQVEAMLNAFGIPLVPSVFATDVEQAVEAYQRFERAVALKAVVPGLLHKSDEGAVLLELSSTDAVRSGAADLWRRFQGRLRAVQVQPMADSGVELLVGVSSDAMFGPLVVCGLGGVATDVLGDRCHRLVPLTDVDAADLVRSLRAAPLLTGFRGARPVDLAAVHDVLLRVARLAELLPEVAELDLNPVLASESGCTAVDARIRVEPRQWDDPFLRKLRL